MLPISLAESGESTAQVSLEALFHFDEAAAAAPADEPDMFELACRGGWPALIRLGGTEARPASRGFEPLVYSRGDVGGGGTGKAVGATPGCVRVGVGGLVAGGLRCGRARCRCSDAAAGAV